MRKRLIISLLLVGTTALAAGATVDAKDPPPCPGNKVCILADNDYVGRLGYRPPGLGIMNVSSAADDRMDSWQNRTRKNAAWFSGPNGGGDCSDMGKGKRDPNINFLASDDLSSWRTNGKKC